eukprot:Plantae.Rhodophyta-Purpureofilum_apyrenoidigerum.ctg28857.p1 GENE.Plantae.Rhodophyta-Purpureofilum_apyrenoidigerum.ctg28857~~Plantae.Rhodophyta-Purpureofilum_apyrenoidigerum.ctg28857.p1  ORF type:complete len:236 (+),score=26.91 Plantae.Rhodophyta-Purpureofilum_apyrenoidigerum.ctg28857:57-710(+)
MCAVAQGIDRIMAAFVGGGCFTVGKAARRTCVDRRGAAGVRVQVLNEDVRDEPVVRFKTREEGKKLDLLSQTKSSDKPKTRSQVILEQIEETKKKLGVDEVPVHLRPRPQSKAVDLSKVNALYGFGSSAFTFAIFCALFTFTNVLIQYYSTNPFQSDVYVVNRIYSVVKTAMVTIFSLATGIVGVTSLGILGLSCQVTYMQLTGKFDKKDESNTVGS